MAVECSSSLTRRVALGAAGAALALLGGCVVVSAEPYEIGAPVVYSGAAYAPYYGSAYYGAPAYYYGAPGYYPYWLAPQRVAGHLGRLGWREPLARPG